MDIRHQKEELRQRLLKQREAIPEPEFYGASAEIIGALKEQAEFKHAETIHCYVSMNQRREVETRELVREMLSKDKRVVVPVTNFGDRTLRHIHITSYGELETNKWGVLEPSGGKDVSLNELELVIVPMVGGDEECNRMGYGEGFYDRFLREVSCPTIGLIFDRNIVKSMPTEDFDVPLDKIISEQRIIRQP